MKSKQFRPPLLALAALLLASLSPLSRAADEPAGEWYHFDEAEPWRRAQTLDRPILLVITARWSAESNRFLGEVLTAPAVAEVIRTQFVGIVVDADARPDLRDRYVTPGWPSVTILTPKGDPVYFKPDKPEKAKPVRMTVTGVPADTLADFLREAAAWYRVASSQGGATSFAGALAAEIRERDVQRPGKSSPSDAEAGFEQVRSSADLIQGGFTKTPKYLIPEAVEAALLAWRLDGAQELRAAAEGQMRGVRNLIDAADGGVHRLAIREDWSGIVPERMLTGNAAALEAFAELWRATGTQAWLDDARRVAGFLMGPMSNTDGSFVHALSSETLPRMAYTGSTARAARALLRFAVIADDDAARARALKAIQWIEATAWSRGRGVRHAPVETEPGIPVLLDDQVALLGAELELYEQTGRSASMERALDIARFLRDNLRDPKTGALRDRIPLTGGPRLMQSAITPYEDNYEAARLFARLHYYTRTEHSEERWAPVAGAILDSMAGRPAPLGAKQGARAVAAYEYHEGPAWVIFVGNPDSGVLSRRLLDAAARLPFPFRLRKILDPAVPADFERIETDGLAQKEPPAVYLRQGTVTSAAAIQPQELDKLYADLQDMLKPPEPEAAAKPGDPALKKPQPPAKKPGAP